MSQTEPTKWVNHILGTSYSGSSLLNALLDTQPAIRGLGEACHWFDGTSAAWCTQCQGPMVECKMSRLVNDPEFWDRVFELYPEATNIVHSSKAPDMTFKVLPSVWPPYNERCIVLYKYPHEFCYSAIHHGEIRTVKQGLDLWVQFYRWIRKTFERQKRTQFTSLAYRELVVNPSATVANLCEEWETPFHAAAILDLWQGKPGKEPATCTLGGNCAVYAQATGNAIFLDNPKYLSGKYQDTQGLIFVDQQWRTDDQFIRQCREYYYDDNYAPRADRVAADLGYTPGVAGFLDDLAP